MITTNGAHYICRKGRSNYRLNVEVRAYDEGVAFRYYFPEHPKAIFYKVVGDLTEYTFPEGTKLGPNNGHRRILNTWM